jgi:phosphoserine phosphatase RsbU/P
LRIAVDGSSEAFPAEGPPLGILHGMQFPEQRCDLHGASLYLFSDGVTDVRDAAGRALGVEGVEAALIASAGLKPEARLRRLVRRLRGMQLVDDTTLMLIEGPAAAERRLLLHRFPARPEALADMRHRVAEALAVAGVGACERQQLVLALDEAACNVIRHGYGGPCDDLLSLSVVQHDAELRFELDDGAPCVGPDCLQPRDLGECRPGGLGLNIIDAAMDDWQLAPRPGGGNRLSMRKRIRAS